MKGLCACGCGGRTEPARRTDRAKGHVKGEPLRYLHNHHRQLSPVEYVEDESGCWVWQRAKGWDGYGLVGQRTAHRAYYERRHGPVPKGLDLDHLCRNKSCVNPDHLEPVTRAENLRRGREARGV